MAQNKKGPDATPRVGLDLGRQVLDGSGGSDQEDRTGTNEEKIRQRAYEIWEKEGRSGDPQDHWHRAVREVSESEQERSAATVEDTPPVSAVDAVEAVSDQPGEEAAYQKKTRRKRT